MSANPPNCDFGWKGLDFDLPGQIDAVRELQALGISVVAISSNDVTADSMDSFEQNASIGCSITWKDA
ncbi:hypothetical protein [Rhodoferax sp.]|uniref:hypothetical protein n=1 Tax=Rhodoferax sp. TaxID=50421 RepID=UPI00284637D9|nr:hypothetical protein [Rhodoferax sp.]MDR3367587.1 hypothetical protein [Rhodoferax sp.]